MSGVQFNDFNVSAEILRALSDMGFEEPTPIQSQAIPLIMSGKDIIGQAQTGTGKTCAFAIPAIEMLDDSDSVQVLVLCPTRELAIQTSEEFKSVAKYTEGVRVLPIYGGQPIERQISSLKKRPQIIIGTPGRIMDHMRRSTIRFGSLRTLVLDEADEMLSMGFQEDLDTILKKTPDEKQTVLFSATMPEAILEIAKKYQNAPEHIKILHKEITVPSIEQYYVEVREPFKLDVLSKIIDANDFKLSIIFCNTKKRAKDLAMSLQTRGYNVEALHGDMRQSERDAVMAKFRYGEINMLVATDVAARGLDVERIDVVFNYDVPNDEEYYVHRIGRTARAGKAGVAYTFISGKEFNTLKDIQKFTKASIKMAEPPTLLDIEENRVGKLLKKAAESAREEDISQYSSYVEKIVDEYGSEYNLTSLDIAAALLRMLFEKTSPKPPVVKNSKKTEKPKRYYQRRK